MRTLIELMYRPSTSIAAFAFAKGGEIGKAKCTHNVPCCGFKVIRHKAEKITSTAGWENESVPRRFAELPVLECGWIHSYFSGSAAPRPYRGVRYPWSIVRMRTYWRGYWRGAGETNPHGGWGWPAATPSLYIR